MRNETKVNTKNSDVSSPEAKNSAMSQAELAVGESAYPLLPLQYGGGNFGLNLNGPHPPGILILDGSGALWHAPDAEWVLRNIDHFTDCERDRMLYCAARHYGFDDAHILIRGRA